MAWGWGLFLELTGQLTIVYNASPKVCVRVYIHTHRQDTQTLEVKIRGKK